MKMNAGQRFMCPCGRSFSTEISIRETTHMDASSPPATPMITFKNDLKHVSESISKRSRILMIDPSGSNINIGGTSTSLIDRLNSSSLASSWSTNTLKAYANSPGLLNRFT
jgi:hypothetical protein